MRDRTGAARFPAPPAAQQRGIPMATTAIRVEDEAPGQNRAAAAAAAEPTEPASLADVMRHRGRTSIEICDKPGEITLLLQLARGRKPPAPAPLDRRFFDQFRQDRLVAPTAEPPRRRRGWRRWLHWFFRG